MVSERYTSGPCTIADCIKHSDGVVSELPHRLIAHHKNCIKHSDGVVSELDLCHTHRMKFNPVTVREDIRRLGIIITSAGLLNALLEAGGLLATAALALGNQEYKP